MDRIRTSGEAPAVLAGSLGSFPILDVLALLATTRHVGEVKVVREGADDHFWVDAGDLIDTNGGATSRLFDLARADDAWFTVTATDGVPKAGARMALATVIEHLTPRLAEWQALRTIVPLDATARMAPSTSRPEVHVKADQWRVLSRLGGGRRVGDVVDESETTPVETLRTLRELTEAGLVDIVAAPSPPHRLEEPARAAANGTRLPSQTARAGADETRSENAGARPEDTGARPQNAGTRQENAGAPPEDATAGGGRGGGTAPARPRGGRQPAVSSEPAARPRRSGGEPPPPTVLMPVPLLTGPWAGRPR